MIPYRLSDLPYIVLLRSDALLVHLLHLGVYQQEKGDPSGLLSAGIRTLCANTLRKDDIDHIIGRVVRGKFSADYDLGFLSLCFERFFKYDKDDKRVICDKKMIPELSSLSRYTHPYFVICFDVAKRYVSESLNLEQVAFLARNTSPLGIEVSYNKPFADNHVHLGGCNESPTSLLHIACSAGNDEEIRLPYLNALPFCTSGQLTPRNLLDLFKGTHFLLTEFGVSGDSAIPLHIEQIDKVLKNREERLSNHQETCLYFFGKILLPEPSESHHHLLWKAIDAYKAGDDDNAFFLYITALYCIYLNYPNNITVRRFIKCFIHLANILRSSMVMSEGIGLGSFKEYYGSSVRRFSRARHRTVARSVVMSGTTHIEGRLAPSNLSNECTDYIKSLRWAEVERNTLHPGLKIQVDVKFCVHLLRIRSNSSDLRYLVARREARRDARKLDNELRSASIDLSESVEMKIRPEKRVPLITLITGFDVAGDESLAPIEVYAPTLRFLRRDFIPKAPYKKTQGYENDVYRFKLCLHAGEDFGHILLGMRKIDETVVFCEMRAGDRIGHAVALGIDPAAWISSVREGLCSKCEFLDNLVWAVNQAPKNRHFRAKWKNVISKYNDWIANLSTEIYGAEYSAATLYNAWLLRRNCPTCRDRKPKGSFDDYRYHAAPDYGPSKVPPQETRDLFWKYLEDATTYKKGEEKLLFRGHDGDVTADYVIDDEEVRFLRALQKHMLKRLTDLKIAIECSVSSNTFIGNIDGFGKHPIFAWSPPNSGLDQVGEAKKAGTAFSNLCICSDDPAIFCTSLQNEFHLLRETAARSKQKYQESEIDHWLERLRKRGIRIFKSTT
jgi:hypothetical protein